MRLVLLAIIIIAALLLSGVLTITGFQAPQVSLNADNGIKKIEQGWRQILNLPANQTNTTTNQTGG